MEKIHPDATPINIKDNKQVGWRFEHKYFTFDAIQSNDGRVDVYIILWGDDQPTDTTWFIDWEGVRRYLEILLKGSG